MAWVETLCRSKLLLLISVPVFSLGGEPSIEELGGHWRGLFNCSVV